MSPPTAVSSLLLPADDGKSLGAATSHAMELSKCRRRAIKVLLEAAKLYESHAHAVSKGCAHASPSEYKSCMMSHAYAYGKLCQRYRGISHAWQRFLITNVDATHCLYERHQECQQTAQSARKQALRARQMYVLAHQEAQSAIAAAGGGGDPSPTRCNNKVVTLKNRQQKYRSFVEAENEAFREHKKLEIMALETMQTLELDSYIITTQCLARVVASIQEANTNAHRKHHDEDDSSHSNTNNESFSTLDTSSRSNASADMGTPNKRFQNIAASLMMVGSSVEEEGDDDDMSTLGMMDAEILGLPEDIGVLRDRVREISGKRWVSINTARSIARLLDNLAKASKELGLAMQSQNTRFDAVLESMKSSEEHFRILELWDGLSNAFKIKGVALILLSSKLTHLRSQYLDPIMEYGENVLKPATTRDDATWKQLCDAARTKSKEETQHREIAAQVAKVRDRCKSVDSGNATAANRQVSESLANVFSILPNGGEHVMKVLDSSTRASVAQLSLLEANQKELKARQMLDSAVAFLELSLEAYKTSAESVLKQCEQYETNELTEVLDSFQTIIREFYERCLTQNESLQTITSTCQSDDEVHLFMENWSQKIANLARKLAQESISDDFPLGETPSTKAPLVLEELDPIENVLFPSKIPHKELEKEQTDEKDPAAIEVVVADADATNVAWSPQRQRTASASSIASTSGTPEKTSNWILKSLSLPESSESIFRKMTGARSNQLQHITLNDLTAIFAKYFLPEKIDVGMISTFTDSFACSFRENNQNFPAQYGRLFISETGLVFVSWSRKYFSVKWSELLDIATIDHNFSNHIHSLHVQCKKGSDEDVNMILSGFFDLQVTYKTITRIRQEAIATTIPGPALSSSPTESQLTPENFVNPPDNRTGILPSDEVIDKMEIILSRVIPNMKIERFYEIVWSEGNNTSEQPFFKPWLEKECFDVELSDWVYGEVHGPWCKDIYNQKRTIKYKVKRRTHLYIGPPIANVFQVRQNCEVLFAVTETDGFSPLARLTSVE